MTERSEQALPGIPAAAAAAGRPGRRTLLRAGLLVGAGAAIGGLTSAAFPGTAQAATAGRQSSWAFCDFCKGLYFSDGYLGSYSLGTCPYWGNSAGAPGHFGSTYNYSLQHDYAPSSDLQTGWNYCGFCAALFYGPRGTAGGRCPVNNAVPHQVGQAVGGSYDYDLGYDIVGSKNFQVNWAWCRNCAGLFFATEKAGSFCPIGANYQIPHNGTGSYAYGLDHF
jgi:hypothetical protein